MKMYSVQGNGSFSGGRSSLVFLFDLPNIDNPTLVYFWMGANALDSTTSLYINPVCFAYLGSVTLAVPLAPPLPNISLQTGSAINNNGSYIVATNLLPWVGELTLPSVSLRVSCTAGYPGSANMFTCTFWVQLGFLE